MGGMVPAYRQTTETHGVKLIYHVKLKFAGCASTLDTRQTDKRDGI